MRTFILFVCTGNICRSPMAVALFRAHAAEHGDGERFRVESAGTWGVDGAPASANAQLVLQKRGLSLAGHVARTVSPELIEQADLVIVMTRSHRDALAAEFPQARSKLHLMSEFAGLEYDISDPYGQSLAAYEMCAADLEQLIKRGYARIPIWLEGTPQRATQE
jgi:protein-tyrosine phosphatase